MEEKILKLITDLKIDGISNVNLLALVSSTSYEVVFYGNFKGHKYQSNELIEADLVKSSVIEDFYKQIVIIIRESEYCLYDKMNVVICGLDNKFDISHYDTDCSLYNIKKAWKEKLKNIE